MSYSCVVFLIIKSFSTYFHVATLSNSHLQMLTCSIVSSELPWMRRISLMVICKCLYVFFPPRSLAFGFTMSLLERGGSHSCCFYTASLSSGRSKGRRGGCGGAVAVTVLVPLHSASAENPTVRLCLFSCVVFVTSVTSLKFPLTVRNP